MADCLSIWLHIKTAIVEFFYNKPDLTDLEITVHTFPDIKYLLMF